MIGRKSLAAAGACFALAPSIAAATAITFEFSGTLTSVDPALAPALSVGESFSGFYTFESTTPDSSPLPNASLYDGAISTFSVQIGSNVWSASGDYIGLTKPQIFILSEYRAITAGATVSGPALNGLSADEISVNLFEFVLMPLASDALPLDPMELNDFSERLFEIRFNQQHHARGDLARFELRQSQASVPEPASLLLVGLGLLGLAWSNRYRSGAQPGDGLIRT